MLSQQGAAAKNPADEKRLAKKTFNGIARGFFREIGKIFPNDAKLIFLNDELERFSKDKQKDHVPAMQFFKAMNLSTELPSEAGGGGMAVVGEMILNHDERLFSTENKAQMPQLDALSFKQKWGALSPENRGFVWGYLERMAQQSARVAALQVVDSGDVFGLLSAVTQAASKVDDQAPGMSDDEKVRAVMSDPTVASLARSLTGKMGQNQ